MWKSHRVTRQTRACRELGLSRGGVGGGGGGGVDGTRQ
jgi:hypothetical protein